MKWLHPRVRLRGALAGDSAERVWKNHLSDLRGVYFFGCLAVLLTTLAEVAVPHIVKLSIDTLSHISSVGVPAAELRFKKYFYVLLALYVIQYVGRLGWRLLLAQQAHHVGAVMKSLIWDRARFLPRLKIERELRPGELMNVATADVSAGRFSYSFTLVMIVDMIWLFILTVSAMLLISPKLTLWTLVIMPVLPYFLHRISVKEGRLHDVAQESLSGLSDLTAQAVSTIRLQRLTQTGAYWKARLFKASREYMEKRQGVIFTGLQFIPFTGLASIVSYIVLLAVGIGEVIHGRLSVGSFVAMQSYVFLIQVPLIELGETVAEWQRGFTSLRRLAKVYSESEAPRLRSGGLPVKSKDGPVLEVKRLHFKVPGSGLHVIEDLSLTLRPQERLGILGPVGSGKSTLIHILAGFENDFEGEVLFHGEEIRLFEHAGLRRRIGIVPQKVFLFADTIRNNVKLDLELHDAEIWRYLKLAAVDEDVRNFPAGLDTRIGEWGVTLSGGQKQRLTLARALARRPEVLLLDDCLSAIDTVTEERILQGLDRELSDTTLIWVAHRKSTLKYCDQILEMTRDGP